VERHAGKLTALARARGLPLRSRSYPYPSNTSGFLMARALQSLLGRRFAISSGRNSARRLIHWYACGGHPASPVRHPCLTDGSQVPAANDANPLSARQEHLLEAGYSWTVEVGSTVAVPPADAVEAEVITVGTKVSVGIGVGFSGGPSSSLSRSPMTEELTRYTVPLHPAPA